MFGDVSVGELFATEGCGETALHSRSCGIFTGGDGGGDGQDRRVDDRTPAALGAGNDSDV